MRLERILNAELGELAGRSAQEAMKWLEARWSLPRREAHPKEIDEALRGFLGGTARQGRFFAGALDEETPRLLDARRPDARGKVIEAIWRSRRGRFDLLGYRGLDFGAPIDWHLDPVSHRRSPRVHWSRIDPLDRAQVGDSKVVWELNRHQWWLALAQAYSWSKDDAYVEELLAHASAWRDANRPGQGINWSSSLEVSLRLISWCWALFLMRGSPALRSGPLFELVEGVRDHALHVERYLSRHFSPNTHLTGEALGLFYAGTAFPELSGARRWRALGARILCEESARQVLPDGVYFEQSTCYQRYSVEIYLHFLILAAQSGWEVPGEVGERVQRMLDFLLAVQRPDGSMPQIGDADGGWILPLFARAPDDPCGIFSTAAAWFGRADYAWAAGALAPETLWLLGAQGEKKFTSLRPAAPEAAPSRLFAGGGYAVMRDGWGSRGHQLIFDVGPLGCPVSAGHGHADLLSLQCSVFGEPVIVDPGTYCYQGEPGWRDRFRGTAFHSTVTIDGAGQATPEGPFGWKERPRARLRRWLSTPELDVADASHDAYGRLPDPVRHRRRILFVKPRYWVVVDDLEGAAEHRVTLHYQFAPMRVSMGGQEWACARTPGGRRLFLRPFSAEPLHLEIREGQTAPMLGWISTDYGQRRPAPQLLCTATALLPLRIATLLVPAAEAFSAPPEVQPLFAGHELVGLELSGRERICIDGDEVAWERLSRN
jgi:hypothetical protein